MSLGQAARRTSLWIVVGLRFRVAAIDLILAPSARRVATCLVLSAGVALRGWAGSVRRRRGARGASVDDEGQVVDTPAADGLSSGEVE
jgi:hypothetical protein